jgi:hypothetical protein
MPEPLRHDMAPWPAAVPAAGQSIKGGTPRASTTERNAGWIG